MKNNFKLLSSNNLNYHWHSWIRDFAMLARRFMTADFCHYVMNLRRHDKVCQVLILVVLGSIPIRPCPAGAEPAPLSVGEVRIVTRDIYAPEEIEGAGFAMRMFRQAMNGVHTSTRRHVIARELLFRPGDPFDPARLQETERNLRTLGFLNSIEVVPVDTTFDGRVTVEVRARESWTLETSFAYARASSGETRWNVRFSDNNFLGRGLTLGAGLGADETSSFWNLWYRQRRMFGAAVWFGVDFAELESGHSRGVFLSRPFWAQDDAWGWNLQAWDSRLERKYFLSNASPAGLDPARPASLHVLLPLRDKGIEASLQRRVHGAGAGRIWRLGAGVKVTETGYVLDQPAYELSDDRFVDLGWLQDPGRPPARIEGTTVFTYLWLRTEGRRWDERRFILQYGPVEDLSLDLVADVKVGPIPEFLGSTAAGGRDRIRTEGWVEKWLPLGSGLLMLRAEGEGESGGAGVANHLVSGVAGWVGLMGGESAPWVTRAFAEYAHGSLLDGSRALVLGLERGVRTLEFDGMAGDRLARWNLEQGKVLPGEVLGLFRMGGALFYSGGSAWWNDEIRGPGRTRHEVGAGIRFGPTRSRNARVGRIDLAWDLDGGGPVFTATTRGLF